MEDYQKRVVDERNYLAVRMVRLGAFLNKGADVKDLDLLKEQFGAMHPYFEILDKRIKNFSLTDPE